MGEVRGLVAHELPVLIPGLLLHLLLLLLMLDLLLLMINLNLHVGHLSGHSLEQLCLSGDERLHLVRLRITHFSLLRGRKRSLAGTSSSWKDPRGLINTVPGPGGYHLKVRNKISK